ncbi:MAG: bifunctional nuclease family protein [Planctomycetes bacterium]|nr:bifunctional nuclease family protein [Planctomycetota bacterium]
MPLRPCFLSHILLEEQGDQQVIFITEKDGARRIPIVIGALEALAIDRAVKAQKFPRPLTHDLFIDLLVAVGWTCREIRVVDLKEGTFFAELVLAGPDDAEAVLDCRPSDAIALMVRMPGTPLLVAEQVLAEAGS